MRMCMYIRRAHPACTTQVNGAPVNAQTCRPMLAESVADGETCVKIAVARKERMLAVTLMLDAKNTRSGKGAGGSGGRGGEGGEQSAADKKKDASPQRSGQIVNRLSGREVML